MIVTALLSGCTFESFLDFFKPKSVRSVTLPEDDVDLEELKKKAQGYEDEIMAHIEAGDKAGMVYEALGIQYLYRQNWSLAVDSLEKAVSYGNGGDQVHRRLAMAYANRGRELGVVEDYRKAVYHYERAVEKNSTNYQAHYGMAMVLFYGLEQRKQGLSELELAVSGDPTLYDARFALGRMLYDAERKGDALQVYQSLLEDLQAESSPEDDLVADAARNISRISSELAPSDER